MKVPSWNVYVMKIRRPKQNLEEHRAHEQV